MTLLNVKPLLGQTLVVSDHRPVCDAEATWTDSAPQNTEVAVGISAPIYPPAGGRYVVCVANPSPVTSLSVKFQTVETIGGTVCSFDVDEISGGVPAESTARVILENWIGKSLRIVLSNNTALGPEDGFTALIRVRRA